MTPRSLCCSLTLLALLAGVPADAVVVCAKRSGRLLTREACKKRETAALPGAIALVGPAGPQGPTGATGAVGMLPFEVIDATGKQFGTLLTWLGRDAQVVTVVPGIDAPMQFVISISDGAFAIPPDPLWYEQAGCVGAPLFYDGGGIVPLGSVFGTRVYFSRTLPTLHMVQSYEYVPEPDCGTGSPTERQTCCLDDSTTALVSRVESFDVGILGVTPPFSVVPR